VDVLVIVPFFMLLRVELSPTDTLAGVDILVVLAFVLHARNKIDRMVKGLYATQSAFLVDGTRGVLTCTASIVICG
jgi:hypothetical protein